jgi:hypothetical protein
MVGYFFNRLMYRDLDYLRMARDPTGVALVLLCCILYRIRAVRNPALGKAPCMAKEEVKLVVFMEPHERDEFERCGTFCCKPESTAALIKSFCRQTSRLPYNDHFVSIAVLRPDEEPCESGAAIYGFEDKPNISSIPYAILKQSPDLLNSIELVGDDDLKQILTLIAKLWNGKDQYESLMKRVKDLRSLPTDRKPGELLKWTYSRGPHKYSEARLNRCLTWQEVAKWSDCDNSVGNNTEDGSPGDQIPDYFK